MRKAINFDINTKKYEKLTKRKSPTAYKELSIIFEQNDFVHRQCSGYISKESLTNNDIIAVINDMLEELTWLKYCVKKMDVTNIGKQYSLLELINSSFDEIDLLFDKEIDLHIKENIYQYLNEENFTLNKLYSSVLNFV